jgi:hypothetical protein
MEFGWPSETHPIRMGADGCSDEGCADGERMVCGWDCSDGSDAGSDGHVRMVRMEVRMVIFDNEDGTRLMLID